MLRSALREQLRMIHHKMEAKRIARIALAEIRDFLDQEEEKKEEVWTARMKTLEEAQDQLREETLLFAQLLVLQGFVLIRLGVTVF